MISRGGQLRDKPVKLAENHAKASEEPALGTSVRLAEVWGDTVDLRHLAWSVCLGAAISIGAFKAGQRVFSSYALEPEIAPVYAMLVGLSGCLMAGVICAWLFKPKREVVEHGTDAKQRTRVLDQLANDAGGLGSITDLSPSARAEMQELGILELFAAYEGSIVEAASVDTVGQATRALGQGQG